MEAVSRAGPGARPGLRGPGTCASAQAPARALRTVRLEPTAVSRRSMARALDVLGMPAKSRAPDRDGGSGCGCDQKQEPQGLARAGEKDV